MSIQQEAFPFTVVEYLPFGKPFCKHATGRAVVENGDAYIVKGWNSSPEICAKEWFITSLADSLKVPVPEFHALRMSDGNLVFGSKIVPDKLPTLEISKLLFDGPSNELITPTLRSDYSRILAFDILTGNYDRHIDNFIASSQSGADAEQKVVNLHAIDFDASDLLDETLSNELISDNSHTLNNAKLFVKKNGFDTNSATSLFTMFKSGRTAFAERSFIGMPSSWYSDSQRAKIITRMNSKTLENRMAKAEEGLRRGSHF